jgi:hypothetical protein
VGGPELRHCMLGSISGVTPLQLPALLLLHLPFPTNKLCISIQTLTAYSSETSNHTPYTNTYAIMGAKVSLLCMPGAQDSN